MGWRKLDRENSTINEEIMPDPVELALMTAPPDDETMTEHERTAWEANERRRQRGQTPISHDELLRDLGVTKSDLR